MSQVPWWKDAAVYRVYPRSFADSDGDGDGDFGGLLTRLDYLTWLGVHAVWLAPIGPVASGGGHRAGDPTGLDPVLGGLAQFDRLLAEAHRRGLKVLVDADPDSDRPGPGAATRRALRFWLDRGVDGFGIAAVPRARVLIRDLRALLDSYPGERVLAGEPTPHTPPATGHHHGDGAAPHLALNTLSIGSRWDAGHWRDLLDRVPLELGPADWPTWALSNHDSSRHRTRFGGSERRARAAAVLLLTLRGTPLLFQGEELGQEDAPVPASPGHGGHRGGAGSRAPIPWTRTPSHGWPGARPRQPWPPEARRRNVAVLRADPTSILHVYRRLLHCRARSLALRRGRFEPLVTAPEVLGYRRVHDVDGRHDLRAVLVNFAPEPLPVPLPGDWVVEVSSAGSGECEPYGGELAGECGVVLTPRSWAERIPLGGGLPAGCAHVLPTTGYRRRG